MAYRRGEGALSHVSVPVELHNLEEQQCDMLEVELLPHLPGAIHILSFLASTICCQTLHTSY